MKFEKTRFFGERETFQSLCERKATEDEFVFNGFIRIYEQPERSKREDPERGCGALSSAEMSRGQLRRFGPP